MDTIEIEDIEEELNFKFKRYILNSEQKLNRINSSKSHHLRDEIIQRLTNIKNILESRPKLISAFPDCERLNNFLLGKDIDFNSDIPILDLVELSLAISELPMYIGNRAIEEINHEIQALLAIIQPYESDDEVVTEYYVSWSYPDDEFLIKDCINARFIDWLSDLRGKDLISKIFSLIESADIDGKKEVTITVNEIRGVSEYTDFASKKMITILDVDVPFPLSRVKEMFHVLGYETNFERVKEKTELSVGYLTIRWNS